MIWIRIKFQAMIIYIPESWKKQKAILLTPSKLFLIYPYVKVLSLPTGRLQMSPQSLKNGDRNTPGNYRPFSLTSIVGKMLESKIRDKIVTYRNVAHWSVIRNTVLGTKDHVYLTCLRFIMTCSMPTTSPDLYILCTLIFKKYLIKFHIKSYCSRSSNSRSMVRYTTASKTG